MSTQAAYAAVAVGVVTTLAVGFAVLEGVVLSIDSLPVAAGIGVLAGLALGGAVLFVAAGGREGIGRRRVGIGAALFGVVGLLVFFAAGLANLEGMTALAVAVAVGAVAGIGAYAWLREQDSRKVQAVTMR